MTTCACGEFLCSAYGDVEGMCYACASKAAQARLALLEREIQALLQGMPDDCVVRVCEGSGPEDALASLAVSLVKLQARCLKAEMSNGYEVIEAKIEKLTPTSEDLLVVKLPAGWLPGGAQVDALASHLKAVTAQYGAQMLIVVGDISIETLPRQQAITTLRELVNGVVHAKH